MNKKETLANNKIIIKTKVKLLKKPSLIIIIYRYINFRKIIYLLIGVTLTLLAKDLFFSHYKEITPIIYISGAVIGFIIRSICCIFLELFELQVPIEGPIKFNDDLLSKPLLMNSNSGEGSSSLGGSNPSDELNLKYVTRDELSQARNQLLEFLENALDKNNLEYQSYEKRLQKIEAEIIERDKKNLTDHSTDFMSNKKILSPLEELKKSSAGKDVFGEYIKTLTREELGFKISEIEVKIKEYKASGVPAARDQVVKLENDMLKYMAALDKALSAEEVSINNVPNNTPSPEYEGKGKGIAK